MLLTLAVGAHTPGAAAPVNVGPRAIGPVVVASSRRASRLRTRRHAATGTDRANYRPYDRGHSPWNTRLPQSPLLEPYDRRRLAWLRSQALGNFFWSPRVTVPYVARTDASLPVYFANRTDPLVTLTCFETYFACPFAGRPMRVPAHALPQSAGKGDAHLVSIQPDGREFDLYEARNSGTWIDGRTYEVGFGGIGRNVATDSGWNPPSIAVAAGAALFGGVVRLAELNAGPGGIHHALAVSTPCGGNTSVYPALGHATQACRNVEDNPSGEQDIPLGAHLWLDLTHAKINRLTRMVRDQKTVLYALHDYGAYVEDTNANQFTLNLQWTPLSQASALRVGKRDAIGARAAANMRLWYVDDSGHRVYHLTSDNIRNADGRTPFDLLAHLHVLDPCESHNPRSCGAHTRASALR